MNVEGGMQLSTLIPFRDDRFPSNLGNFKLDEHNVDEWSDTKDPSLLRHRGRKEVGKWVDTERNADIQIHRVSLKYSIIEDVRLDKIFFFKVFIPNVLIFREIL